MPRTESSSAGAAATSLRTSCQSPPAIQRRELSGFPVRDLEIWRDLKWKYNIMFRVGYHGNLYHNQI